MITARLRLLAMAATFWLALGAGVGVLAASGHCMTTAWALQPVCGSYFWWVIVTSPEVLIFLFFMITDPKTIPTGRVARVVFAVSLAVVCTLLMAPQTTEFGAKVGLLAGLVVMTPLRFLYDRLLSRDDLARWPLDEVDLLIPPTGRVRIFARGTAIGSLVVVLAVGIIAAGAPARENAQASAAESPVIDIGFDPATLPPVTVSAEAAALSTEVAPEAMAVYLAENLAIEGEAMLRADTSSLRAADDAERLVEMERRIEVAATRGALVVPHYTFDTLHLDVTFTDGPQGGASLGLEATGTVETVTYDAAGAEQARASEPFGTTWVLRPGTGDRWLIVSEVEHE